MTSMGLSAVLSNLPHFSSTTGDAMGLKTALSWFQTDGEIESGSRHASSVNLIVHHGQNKKKLISKSRPLHLVPNFTVILTRNISKRKSICFPSDFHSTWYLLVCRQCFQNQLLPFEAYEAMRSSLSWNGGTSGDVTIFTQSGTVIAIISIPPGQNGISEILMFVFV